MANPVPSHQPADPATAAENAVGALPTADTVRDALRQVVDPEVGLNIVDMGLVYRIEVTPATVEIDLTMTSPACPMGDLIVDDAHAALQPLVPPGARLDLRLVWEPPWEPSMMSSRAKLHFDWQ